MVPEQADIVGKDMEIRERSQIIVEIDTVIPDENIVSNPAPAFYRLHKLTSGRIFPQSHLPVAVNVAKHNIHIRKRLYVLWRLHCIKVCKSREFLVRKSLRKLVEKMYDTSRQRAFIFVYSLAGIALAICKVAVILTDRNHIESRIGLENGIDTFAYDFKDFRIAQTPLACLARMTFATEIRIILRMFNAISR